MSLAAGNKLGPYEIQSPLGAGGMGEVYRARDTRLDRTVAIKVLPSRLASDPQFRERFDREARAISSLNHPHICTLHDVGHQSGMDFLVMEYLEGETIAVRLNKGPLPLDQVLRYAIEIADALDKAHRAGITHRDLKPGNIMLTKTGTKLLDFGLARLRQTGSPVAITSLSAAPTMTTPLTGQGHIMGTLHYMSPEQVEGKEADARTDIFTFGVVIYEMATGKRAFEGKSQASIIAKILEHDPPPMSALQPMTPPALDRVVKRCLAKDADERWQSAKDLTDELKWIAEGGSQVTSLPTSPVRGIRALGRRALLLSLGALLCGAAVATLATWNLKPSPPIQAPPPTRFILTLPNSEPLALGDRPALAISPDGTQLVYVARHGGTTQLYLRSLDRIETVPIAGTEGGEGPFFSPDGKRVGFFADAKLKTVSLTGGLPIVLCTATNVARGTSWGPDDNILFTPDTASGLFKVPASGGLPERVTTPDREKGERGHRWPEILPGGKAVIFTTGPGGNWVDRGRIAVLSLITGKWRTLIEGGTDAHYLPTGHLLFIRSGDLFAVPFDSATLEVKGAPVPVLENLSVSYATGGADFALSRNGTLVHVYGSGSPQRSMVWVDRKGVVRTLPAPPRAYRDPRISPDGRRAAVSISSGTEDIWVYDLTRDTLTRVTFEGNNVTPVWTPDSKRIVYSSAKNGREQISITAADGSEPEDILTTENYRLDANSVSPDGSLLAYTDFPPITGGDVWLLPLKGDHKPRAYLNASYDERQASFSPDGRWMAYTSNESGTGQVFVQAFPVPGSKWQISTDGGTEPAWSRNGRELFYRNGNKLMVVSILTTPGFTAARPRLLFEWGSPRNPSFGRSYDVAPDGQRFLMIKASEEESTSTQISIVLNWSELLKKK